MSSPEYRIPFDQDAHPVCVCQGFHGPYHERRGGVLDLAYAVDFALPIGSIVHCARAGIVRLIRMDSTECYRGMDEQIGSQYVREGNKIVIEHDDHTFAVYEHLRRGSSLVRERDTVHVGQELAETGESGWMGDITNLHFHVHKWIRPTDDCPGYNATMPIAFVDYDGPLEHERCVSQQ